MDLFDVISNDIKEAMKAKDKVKLETLLFPAASTSEQILCYVLVEIIQESSNTFQRFLLLVFNFNGEFDFCLCHSTQIYQ